MFNKEKMDDIIKEANIDLPAAILLHPSPDPDCMGAASGMALLLREVYKIESKIFHFGEVSHPMNKVLKNKLNIVLHDGVDFVQDDHSLVIVLDSDLETSGFKNERLTEADIRIDHHSTDKDNGAKFKDIRVVGSTCTIVWQYLKEYEVNFVDFPLEVTALVLGIKTDTLDFTRSDTTDLDIEAYCSLLPFVNKNAMAKIIRFPLPRNMFEVETRAFRDRKTRNAVLVSFVGEITSHSRDLIPTIADRFSRIDTVSTAVIMGIMDNFLIVSVRSEDSQIDVNELCINTFGKGNAGGKAGSGGARYDLGPAFQLINDKEIKDRVRNEIVESLTNKIFENLGEQKEEDM